VLRESEGLLCDQHATRYQARRLRVFALSAAAEASEEGTREPAQMVGALEACVDCMQAHLPPAHPELAFFRRRLSQALALAQHPLRRSQHPPRPARTLRAAANTATATATATATTTTAAALAAGAKLL